MAGHVLIVDASLNRRIHLRAQLDTAAYPVEFAETMTEALLYIQKDPPDVVIIADDLPGLRLRHVCKLLRTRPQTQLTTIVVAVAHENHSARVSALIEGAHDVIDHHSDPADLKARLRNFMRIKQSTQDSRPPAEPEVRVGLAEASQSFLPKTVVTFVTPEVAVDVPSRLENVARETGFETRITNIKSARRSPDEDTDVFVLFETGSGTEARDLLGALQSHPKCRHSRILFVTDQSIAAASPLDLGAQDQVPLSVSSSELALRIRRLARLKHDADEARKTTTALGEKAYTDPITGLNNRQAMDDYLRKTDRALSDHARPIALLIADIDHFKAINDNHGHAAGDDILGHIARLLKANLRDGDFVARYGGEEFLVVLPDVGPAQARSVAQRLRTTVSKNPKAIEDGTHVRATISIGVAHARRTDRVSTKDLRRAADSALYRAKRNGRNRIEIATPGDIETTPAQHSKAVTRQAL